MGNTYYELYIHLVWCTKNREPLIKEKMEETLYSVIEEKSRKFKAHVIAKGNTMDHIHLLLSIHPETAIAVLVKEIKGATSYFVNHNTLGNLYWQDGYGVLTVSKSSISVVNQYVEKQKLHHKENTGIIPILEKFLSD